MSNTILIKRGTGSSILSDGELGFNTSTNTLYIGSSSGNKIIGGSGAFLSKNGDTATGQMNFNTVTVNNANAYFNNGGAYFNTKLQGISYIATQDGTSIYIRPDQDNNLFQIVMQSTGSPAFEAFGLTTDGTPRFNKPLPVSFGGTGASSASGALTNLGIIYYAPTEQQPEPPGVQGKIWLKPIS